MSTFTPSQHLSQDHGHVRALLVDVMAGLADASALESESVVTHLLSCEECRAALGIALAAEASQSGLFPAERQPLDDSMARLAESAQERAFSADMELYAAYAEMVIEAGEAAAQARYPLVARHIARCAACRADVAELVGALMSVAATGALAPGAQSASSAAAAPDGQGIWETVSTQVLRLRDALTIIAGQATVSIQSALPGLRAIELSPGVPVLGDVSATVGRQQRLTFTISTASPQDAGAQEGRDRWLRVLLDIKALYDHTVEVTLTTEEVISATPPEHEVPGIPWPGMSWVIERRERDTRRPHSYGATSREGKALFAFQTAGQYDLSLSVGTATWVFPLDIRR